ncbi:unnamed protein product, partial [Rotaria sp. Silwood2]
MTIRHAKKDAETCFLFRCNTTSTSSIWTITELKCKYKFFEKKNFLYRCDPTQSEYLIEKLMEA